MRLIVWIVLGLVLVGLGCVSSPPRNENTNTGSGNVLVSLQNFAFQPNPITINAGQTIEFENDEGVDHDVAVRAPDGSFIQPKVVLSPGETITVTLTQAGTYRIECERHLPGMVGTIIVN